MFLKHQHLVWTAGLFALSLVGGCMPDLGTPDYSIKCIDNSGCPEWCVCEIEIGACVTGDLQDPVCGLREPVDPFPPVPPDPYQPGDQRLSVGYFYETGRSETIPLNTVTTNYFIFVIDQNQAVATLTYSQNTSTDRLEGLESVEITLNDRPFWGGGIIWDEPIDLSEWTTMFVGFKSSDESFEGFDLTLQYARDRLPNEPPPEPIGVTIDPRTYGYTNDGEWHFLQIPFQDLIDRGFDPSNTRSPFIIGGPTRRAGDVLLIDNLYFTKD